MLWPGENRPPTRSKSEPCSIARELPFESYIGMRRVAHVSLSSFILQVSNASTICRCLTTHWTLLAVALGLLNLKTTCRDEFWSRSSQECRWWILNAARC